MQLSLTHCRVITQSVVGCIVEIVGHVSGAIAGVVRVVVILLYTVIIPLNGTNILQVQALMFVLIFWVACKPLLPHKF